MVRETEQTEGRDGRLKGVTRVVFGAIIEMTNVVESMHQSVVTMGGLLGDADRGRTSGLTGMVYGSIRGLVSLLEKGTAADFLSSAADEGIDEASPGGEAWIAALNGVVGDYLEETDNSLAIRMGLRHDGKAIALGDPLFREAVNEADGRILLMVHGSSANDLQWERDGHDHGAAVAERLGYLPVYLRYNSGLHISQNGERLAALLEEFIDEVEEVDEIAIVAHSMGGLVSRSACHYAEQHGHRWRSCLRDMVFLATPHHGALLERVGNRVHDLLRITAYSAPIAMLANVRSAGVTDLRYGNLLDEDWRGADRFEWSTDGRTPVPLPEGVDCFAVGATLGQSGGRVADGVVGDGLVQLDSALGQHERSEMTLDFPESHKLVVRRTGHLDILGDPDVTEAIVEWLGA